MQVHERILISPVDGFAGRIESERVVTLIAPETLAGKQVTGESYVRRFPESYVAGPLPTNHCAELLRKLTNQQRALQFALCIFDSDLTDSARELASEGLEDAISRGADVDVLADVLLSRPLPKSTTIENAIKAVTKTQLAKALIEETVQLQSRVGQLLTIWTEICNADEASPRDRDEILGELVRNGVFRQLAREGDCQKAVRLINSRLLLNKELRAPTITKVLAKLTLKYASSLPKDTTVGSSLDVGYDSSEDGITSNTERRRVHVDVDHVLNQVERQIDAIVNHFSTGNDGTARKYLEDLIDFQTKNTDDFSHVVKSLCNIAQQCTTMGRRNISLYCLDRASQFQRGVDSILYLQAGTAWRTLGEFAKARACYERALVLDDGSKRKSIRLEIIGIDTARGRYADAIAAIESEPDLLGDELGQMRVATLHRKLGNLATAREYYNEILTYNPKSHAAIAGMAESLKQSGKHYEALKRYTKLRTVCKNIDRDSLKVYSLAESHLFRITRQLGNADNSLRVLLEEYPIDPQIHLQFAKLQLVIGNAPLAKQHFDISTKYSQQSELDDLFMIIADVAFKTEPVNQHVAPPVIRPEEQGLMNCAKATLAIQQGHPNEVQEILSQTRYHVDRLHLDFARLLRFHALKMQDHSARIRDDLQLRLLAKRGLKIVRAALAAVDEGEFEVATKFEQELYLRAG